MDLFDKLKLLSDAAKYDVACTSSGVDRKAQKGQIGSAVSCGICHSLPGTGAASRFKGSNDQRLASTIANTA